MKKKLLVFALRLNKFIFKGIVVEEILYNMFTPQYSWNIAKVGVKHQSINLFASVVILLIFIFQYLTLNPPDWLDQVS